MTDVVEIMVQNVNGINFWGAVPTDRFNDKWDNELNL
jgi:hypothetical protein